MKKKKQLTSKARKGFVKNGTYERMQELQFHFPVQFLMLCKLVQVPPKTILNHFMQDLGRDSWQRYLDDRVRTLTADYFSLRGYGRNYYTEEDIRLMLAELNAIGSLWPQGGSMKLIEQHSRWRDRYYKYWFKNWYYKVRRIQKSIKL